MSILDAMLTIVKVITLLTVGITMLFCLGIGFTVKQVARDSSLEF